MPGYRKNNQSNDTGDFFFVKWQEPRIFCETQNIFSSFQNTLNALERDCNEIGAKVDTAIAIDNSARSHNMFAWAKGLSLFFTGILLPLTLVINFFASSISDKLIKDLLGAEGHSYLILFLVCTYIDL